jgi:hypothetical protein
MSIYSLVIKIHSAAFDKYSTFIRLWTSYPVVCRRMHACLIYVICVCLRILVSNTYCVVILIWLNKITECLKITTFKIVFTFDAFLGLKPQCTAKWHVLYSAWNERICLIYVICVCLRILVSNTYCVVFFIWVSSYCVPYVTSFSGLTFFYFLFGIRGYIWGLTFYSQVKCPCMTE